MLPAKILLDESLRNSKITEEQYNEIINECESMYKEAAGEGVLKKIMKVFKHGSEKEIKKPGFFRKALDVIKSPEIRVPLLSTATAMAIGGGIGLGMDIKNKAKINKLTKANFNNLISNSPEFRKEDYPKIGALVKQLTEISPDAAANDALLKQYVKKSMSGKISFTDVAHAGMIKKPGKKALEFMTNPPLAAQQVGQIIARIPELSNNDITFSSFNPIQKQTAITIAGLVKEYPDTATGLNKVMAEKATSDPGFSQKMENATRYPKEAWDEFKQEAKSMKSLSGKIMSKIRNLSQKHEKTGSVETMEKNANRNLIDKIRQMAKDKWLHKDVAEYLINEIGKKPGALDAIKKMLPAFAAFAGVGAGIGLTGLGLEGVKSLKRKSVQEKTLNVIKKHPDFKGKGKEVEMVFDSISKFAPAIAEQPQTAMPLIRQAVLDWKDTSGYPQLSTEQIKMLAEIQDKYQKRETFGPLQKGFVDPFKFGFSGARDVAGTSKAFEA